jgi:hypothetical protein
MPRPLCIHCLAAPAEEKDHVLPRSWYPDGTPPTIQRLTVPSCKPCGARLKKAEEQTALGLMCARGFDKDHIAALGVYDRVRATWDVKAPGSGPALKYRRDRIYSIMSRVRPVIASPAEMVGAARIPARTAAGVWVDRWPRGRAWVRDERTAGPRVRPRVRLPPGHERRALAALTVLMAGRAAERRAGWHGLAGHAQDLDDARALADEVAGRGPGSLEEADALVDLAWVREAARANALARGARSREGTRTAPRFGRGGAARHHRRNAAAGRTQRVTGRCGGAR